MKNIGQLLKAEREKNGLSLQEVALSLKINVRILKAIEDGDETQLPARPFLRGFLRSYSQFLRLDVDETLSLLQKEFEPKLNSNPELEKSEVNKNTGPSSAKIKTDSPKTSQDQALQGLQEGPKWHYLIGAGVLVLLIVFAIKIIEKYQYESTVQTAPEQENAIAQSPETSSIIENLITEAPPHEASIPGADQIQNENPDMNQQLPPVTTLITQAETSLNSAVTSTIVSTTGVSTTVSSPTTSLPQSTTTKTVPPMTTTSSTQPATTTTKPTTTTLGVNSTTTTSTTSSSTNPGRSEEVIVEATGNVNLRFSISPDRWESLSLRSGQIHVFRSRNGIRIEASNGGALKVIVNGRDRGILGSPGKPAQLSIP